jgi:ABC-type nitrate/sulfonate/bicarbonate transport system substrate-binding protein
MESDHSGTGVSSAVPVMDRFGLEKLDVWLIVIIALLVGAWVVVCGNRPYEGMLGRPLRVGIVSWPGYAGGLVANNGLRPSKDSYFWKDKDKEHQLLVEFVLREDETQLLHEFAQGGDRGGLDVIWSTVDSLAKQIPQLQKEGLKPQAFMQVDWSHGADAIVTSADINRIEQLSGKRIAVSQAASQWLFEYSLQISDLSENEKKEIRFNDLVHTEGSEEARDLFINRKVDAAVLWEPDVTKAKKQGNGRVLIDTRAAPKLIADVMVADAEFIKEHKNVIAAFVDGWLNDGTKRANSDPALAAQMLLNEPKFAELGQETTRELVAKTILTTLDDNAEMFGLAEDGDIYFDHLFRRASQTWLKAHYIDKREEVDPKQAREVRFLRELYRTPAKGCQEYVTNELPIAFPRDQVELGSEARKSLDDENLFVQLSSHAGVRFCVEASVEEEDNPQRISEIGRQREEAVIKYLEARYSRLRNQFSSASRDACKADEGDKATPCMRLKLVDPNKGRQ